jgi:pimeloyl-ACP methyl ester carboxylesterase
LVLIPGLNCSARIFAGILGDLWSRGPVMIADHTEGVTIAAIARRILDGSPPRFALWGYSMGGYVAPAIMRAAPERVMGLALLDTSARPDSAGESERRRRLIAVAKAGHFETIPREQYPRLVDPSRISSHRLRSAYLSMAFDCGAERFVRHQQAILERPDASGDLDGVRCPTLVLVGAADRITPSMLAMEIADGIEGARLEVIPRCGHLSPLERPQAVGAALPAGSVASLSLNRRTSASGRLLRVWTGASDVLDLAMALA